MILLENCPLHCTVATEARAETMKEFTVGQTNVVHKYSRTPTQRSLCRVKIQKGSSIGPITKDLLQKFAFFHTFFTALFNLFQFDAEPFWSKSRKFKG